MVFGVHFTVVIASLIDDDYLAQTMERKELSDACSTQDIPVEADGAHEVASLAGRSPITQLTTMIVSERWKVLSALYDYQFCLGIEGLNLLEVESGFNGDLLTGAQDL